MKKRQPFPLFPVFCLSCLLCCLSCLTAFAAARTPEEETRAVVTAVLNRDELAALPAFTIPLRSAPSNDNMEKIYSLALKHRTVPVTVKTGDAAAEEYLPVAWDFRAIDRTAAGEYEAVGRIELPEGYIFGENVPQTIRIPVLVKEMPPAVITSVESWYPYTNAFAVPQNSDADNLEAQFLASPCRLECYSEDGERYTATVEWDLSGIDQTTVGLYHAKGSISAPENTVFAEDLALPEITLPVSVQAPGQPDINCFLAGRGVLVFPWVTPPGDLQKIRVWLSENEGAWTCSEAGIYADSCLLTLSTGLLMPGNRYRLQVDYDGGQTGILSFSCTDDIIWESYRNGDRDGGDQNQAPPDDPFQPETKPSKIPEDNRGQADFEKPGQNLPATDTPETLSADSNAETPSADSSEEASPTETPFPEFSGETADRISGLRFQTMLQTGAPDALFSKQGIRIGIPPASLSDISIRDEDSIEVEIKKEADDRFSFSFSVNGSTPDSMPGVSVMLPLAEKPSDESLYLLDENGAQFPMTDYDDTGKTASFLIDRTGSFMVVTQEDTVPSRESQAPVSTKKKAFAAFLLRLLPLFSLPAIVGIFLIIRRRK